MPSLEVPSLTLTLVSYGVLHRLGPPPNLDLDLCALSLREPPVAGLHGPGRLGTHRAIQDALWHLDARGVDMLYRAVRAFFAHAILTSKEDTPALRIAIHCAAGHQRSPAAVEIVAKLLRTAYPHAHAIHTQHRDLTRPVRKLPLDSGPAIMRHSRYAKGGRTP